MILKNLRQNALEIGLNIGKGNGVEIPVDYRLVANDSYLGKLKRKLSKKDFADDINMSKMQRITESQTR